MDVGSEEINDESIGSDEVVLRHIPGGTTFQAPGPRITRKNFELRTNRGETGVSVSRALITSPDALMARIGNPQSGSLIAFASVAAIHALGLEVVPDPIEDDPGHAEIRSGTIFFESRITSQELAKLFQFVT